MAKKVVATLRTSSGKDFAKVIKMVRSQKTGAYTFEEKIITQDKVTDYFANKKEK
ncbi:MAG: DUF4295 domain-containing protein [Bacteroidales bacterium]|nr:DUF4295 domain-containing protein [Bacteroidales bacterium]